MTIHEGVSRLNELVHLALAEQAISVLLTEEEHTRVRMVISDTPQQFSLCLVTENLHENYRNVHLFLADSAEKAHNQYRQYTFSITEMSLLHILFSQVLDTEILHLAV